MKPQTMAMAALLLVLSLAGLAESKFGHPGEPWIGGSPAARDAPAVSASFRATTLVAFRRD